MKYNQFASELLRANGHAATASPDEEVFNFVDPLLMLNKKNKKKLVVDWRELTFLNIGVMKMWEREKNDSLREFLGERFHAHD